jgi:hypothetical protein
MAKLYFLNTFSNVGTEGLSKRRGNRPWGESGLTSQFYNYPNGMHRQVNREKHLNLLLCP